MTKKSVIKQWIDRQSLTQALKMVLTHLKWHELSLGILLSSLFINCLGLVFPLMLLQFYDRIIPYEAIYTLEMLVIIVVFAIFFEMLLKILRSLVSLWGSARYEHYQGVKVFDALFSHDENKLSPGALINRISGLFNIKDFYGGQALGLLIDLPFVLIYLLLIAYIGGILVFVPLTLLLVFLYFADRFGNRLQTLIDEKKQKDEQRFSFTMEMLQGIETIKSYAMESFMQRRYERLQENASEVDYRISYIGLNSTLLSTYLLQVTLIVVVSLGSLKIMNGELTIGSLAACSLLANRVLSPLAKAMMFWRRLQSILITQAKLEEIPTANQEQQQSLIRKDKLTGDIKLKNISFHFKDSGPIFNHVDLHISPGEFISIGGEGSGGKSILLKLLTGVFHPTEGTILLDDTPIHQYDSHWLRNRIAYIPQKGHLYQGSLIENLSLFDKLNIAKALNWVEKFGMEDKINALPHGYETMLGSSLSQNLPASLQQQIIVIQNLIHDPDVILFDQANQSVDMETDKKFFNLLSSLKGKKTIVVVSHRPSLVKLADKNYIIRDTQVQLQGGGSHE